MQAMIVPVASELGDELGGMVTQELEPVLLAPRIGPPHHMDGVLESLGHLSRLLTTRLASSRLASDCRGRRRKPVRRFRQAPAIRGGIEGKPDMPGDLR